MTDVPLLDRLRQQGWRVTPQRRAVVQVLEGRHVHFTADEVHERARQLVPEVSLATVYNTLNELVAMGQVIEVRAAPGPARYDPNVAISHHHLVCTNCGAMFDVVPSGADAVRLPPAQRHGFAVEDVEIVFRGLCANCR